MKGNTLATQTIRLAGQAACTQTKDIHQSELQYKYTRWARVFICAGKKEQAAAETQKLSENISPHTPNCRSFYE